MTEEWLPVSGYEGFYEVSNLGRVRGLDRHIPSGKGEGSTYFVKQVYLRPAKRNGYLFVFLRREAKGRSFAVHRLIAKSFVENTDAKPCVNHIDGIKSNNVSLNLEWCSHSENNIHALRMGLIIRYKGGMNKLAKVSDENRRKVRKLRDEGYSSRLLAKMYNVCPQTINVICKESSKYIVSDSNGGGR